MASTQLTLTALPGFPLVKPGDDLASLILDALDKAGMALQDGDVLALAQKIVSKAENRYVLLNDIEPGDEARQLAREADKDPRQAELILRESREVLRRRPGVVVVEHRLGYVHANAGIDKSNIASEPGNPRVLLLPEDPDRSARQLREAFMQRANADVCIIINDSAGRAWRTGTVGFAIGSAGFEALENRIGEADLFGRPLEITEVAVADELAAAASYVMGQAAEGAPVVLVRGARLRPSAEGSQCLIRPREQDLFR